MANKLPEGWGEDLYKAGTGDISVGGGTAALAGASPILESFGKSAVDIGKTGAAQALAAAPAYFSKPARESRAEYRDLLDAQKAGKLSWTPQQKRQMMAEAIRASQASTKDLTAKLQREAAALGGTGRSGRPQEAIAKIAKQALEVIPRVAAQIARLSQEQVQRLTGKISQLTASKKKELKEDLTQGMALALKEGAPTTKEKAEEYAKFKAVLDALEAQEAETA
jgi:hypothetical protein